MDSAKKIFKKHFDRQVGIIEEYDKVWVNDKYSHSYEVLEMAEYLIENDGELKNLNEKYIEYGKVASLLHDIGRFYEVGDDRKGFQHGVFGAETVLKNEENIDNPFILLPIKFHDRRIIEDEFFEELSTYSLNKDEGEIVLKLLKLVRDSDKLANLIIFPKRATKFIFYLNKEPYFTKNCLNSFKKRELINNRERNTIFDQILGYIAWVYDLQFESSKNIVFEKGVLGGLVEMIGKEIENISDSNEKLLSDFESVKQQLISDNLFRL